MTTRKEAKEAGQLTYPAVKLCARGHKTERYVSTGNCVECLKLTSGTAYHAAREKKIEQSRAWRNANPHKRREYRLALYGLDQAAFDQMLKDQYGGCAVCGEGLVGGKQTHIDHCHETGRTRGILCAKCNTAIGLLDDCPEKAMSLAAYLRGFL